MAEPIERDGFDLAYSRLLLEHLVDPLVALGSMRVQVRPGGAVAVEDLFLGTLRSSPSAPALDWLQELYGATVRFHGGGPASTRWGDDVRRSPRRPERTMLTRGRVWL